MGPQATTMSAWASFYGNVPILQVDSSTHTFQLKIFGKSKDWNHSPFFEQLGFMGMIKEVFKKASHRSAMS